MKIKYYNFHIRITHSILLNWNAFAKMWSILVFGKEVYN